MAGSHSVVGIHFVPTDSFHWAEFLQQKLSEDGYNIESMLLDLTAATHSHFFETNIILVSPDFFILDNLGLLRTIDPRRAIMVLLGTEAKDLRTFLLNNRFSDMLNFITLFETEASERCVKELLIGIIKLYEHVHENSDEQKEEFDVPPPPRKSSNSKDEYNDIYRVALSCSPHKREVFILCSRKGSEVIQIELHGRNEQIKAVHENKVIYKFPIDKNITTENLQFTATDGQVVVGKGQVLMPRNDCSDIYLKEKKTHSKLKLLEKILSKEDDPICLMCKALNLKETNTDVLDTNLAQKCQCLDPLRKFEGTFFENVSTEVNNESDDEIWPTLLHFAAEYNLLKFCEELLKLPWSFDASLKTNRDDEAPIDIAKRKGHHEVKKKLQHFMGGQARNSNVPGNKDSGVVEDDAQPPGGESSGLTSADSYVDMTQVEIGNNLLPPGGQSSGLTSADSYADMTQVEIDPSPSKAEDQPPPPPHKMKAYANFNEVPPKYDDVTRATSRDIQIEHRISRAPSTSGDSIGIPNQSVPSIQVTHAEIDHEFHRSKSEGQTNGEDEGDDEDYEIPGSPDDDLDAHSTGSQSSTLTLPVIESSMFDIQLPTQAHHERHGGFFKKFKIFGKQHKKEKDIKVPKPQHRKTSMPSESDLKSFQKTYIKPKIGRRGSVQHVLSRKDSISSNSSVELHKDNKPKSNHLQASDLRQKSKHFLHDDGRKSFRIKKAMKDQIKPLPLPSKGK